MCSRRNKPVLQAFIFLGLIASLGYFVYLYNTITFKLDRSERQLNKYVKHQKSLSAQLQVVYEHRARLEKSFEREKADHKNTKEDLEESKRLFFINITRTKHETLNRFNSLETQHRMLKAKHEQLQVEYNRLQQQHARLSAEHISVHNQQVNSFNAMKNQKENEVLGLEAQVNTLKKQVGTWKRQYSTQHEEAEYYKGLHESAQQEVDKYKATVVGLYDKLKKRQSLFGDALNTKNLPGLNDLKKIVHSKIPHGHVMGNADTNPGHPKVTMATRVPLKQDDRVEGRVHEEVDARRNGGKEEEEEADDSDEDNEETKQKAAQVPLTSVTTTPPPVYVPPGTLPDGARPDILRRQQNHREETGYRSRESQNTPIVLQDRSNQESVRVPLAATAQPHQVVPKPLTTKRHERVKQAAIGESEGDMKADSEGEQETEEQRVQRYLSHNAENADNSRRQQQQQQKQQPEQRQQQEQQKEQEKEQQHQEQRQQEEQHQGQERERQQQQQDHLQKQQQQQHQREQNPHRSNRETRDTHRNIEPPPNSQENRDQVQNPLSRQRQYNHLNKQNPNHGLSNLKNRESSREAKQQESNAYQKREKHGEQFRRPIPRPGGGEKKRTDEADSENVEPHDENDRGKNPNLQEEENDNEENEDDEEQDKRENTQDQREN